MATGPNTEIEISSLAAQICGENPFTSYASAGPMGRAAEPMFSALVLGELGSKKWSFCLTSTQVNVWTAIAQVDQFDGWTYKGNLPQDMLVLHSVNPRGVDYRRWGPENGFPLILTKSNQTLIIEYSVDVPVNLWDPPFKLYMAYKLADMLAASSARSDSLYTKIAKGLKEWQEKAEFADSQQNPAKAIQDKIYQEIRLNRRNQRCL